MDVFTGYTLSSRGLKVDIFLVRLITVMSTRLTDPPCLFATQHKILIICVLGVQKVCISLVLQVQRTPTGSSTKHTSQISVSTLNKFPT